MRICASTADGVQAIENGYFDQLDNTGIDPKVRCTYTGFYNGGGTDTLDRKGGRRFVRAEVSCFRRRASVQ